MRRLIFAAVLFCAPFNDLRGMTQVPAQSPEPVEQSAKFLETRRATLDSLRGAYRPLLVFAPAETDQRFQQQLQIFAGSLPEMHERQIVIVSIVAARATASLKENALGDVEVRLLKNDATAARERFHILPHEFIAILIGKDGGEKFRSHVPVTMERLSAVIDAMPMRQQEMQNGNAK